MIQRILTGLFFCLFIAVSASAQTFSFECLCQPVTGDTCDVCPQTNIKARTFSGLMIKKNGLPYRLIDAPYTIRKLPGDNVQFLELIPNPDNVTIFLSQTEFFTVDGFIDSTNCVCNDGGAVYTEGPGINISGDTISAVDTSYTNEGALNVTARGSNDAGIHSNTSGSTDIQVKGGPGVLITDGFASAGGFIQVAAKDTSATNELQTLTVGSNTVTLSQSGGSVTIGGAGGNTISTSGTTITITGTVPTGAETIVTAGTGISVSGTGTSGSPYVVTNTGDLSNTNEIQTYSHSGTTTYTNTLSNSGGSWSITGAGIAAISQTGGAITVTATEVDGSITNELQNLSLSGQTLSISGGTGVTLPVVSVVAGSNITVSNSAGVYTVNGTAGTVTSVAATAPAAGFTISGSPITGSGTFVFTLANDLAALEALSGTGIAVRTAADTWAQRTITAGTGISIADGNGVGGNPVITNSAPDQTVVLTGAGINVVTGTYPTFTITATEVDGSISNELQTLTSSGTGSFTSTLSSSGGSFTIAPGTGITVTRSTNTATIANSAPDQTVILTAGTGISISGTYPGFTITNTQSLPAGTDQQTLRYNGTTLTANSEILNNGLEVGIGGAPLAPFEFYVNGATRTDGIAVFRGSGNIVSALTAAGFRMWNTSGTGDTWYMSSQDDGSFLFQGSNPGSVMTASTSGDIAVTNHLAIGSVSGVTPNTILGRNTTTGFAGAVTVGSGLTLSGGTLSVTGGGSGTVTSVAATAPAAGLTISGSPITTSGTFTFSLADDLAALEAMSGTGFVVRTAANTYAQRTLTAGTGISISANAAGLAGNPTITNTAPDQTVVLTAGTNVTISGTYPSFTINATGGGGFTPTGATNQTLYFSATNTLSPTSVLTNNNSVVGVGVGTTLGSTGKFQTSGLTGGVNSLFAGGTMASGNSVLNVTGTATTAGYILNGTLLGTGANVLIGLGNSATTGSGSNAFLDVNVGGASAGDPYTVYRVSGVMQWVAGVDNLDFDKFRILPSSNPRTNTSLGLTITNEDPPHVGINDASPAYEMTVNGRTRSKVYYNTSLPPSIAYSTGAGTGPTTVTLAGGGNAFYFTFTAGTSPAANGNIFTVTLPQSFPTDCIPVWKELTSTTIAEAAKFRLSTHSGVSFVIQANGTLTAGNTYAFAFHMGGY